MKNKQIQLEKFTMGEVRKLSGTFAALGREYAEKHQRCEQKRTIAWGLVMDYLRLYHASWLEQMNNQGWTQAQMRARTLAVDLVEQGIVAHKQTVAA